MSRSRASESEVTGGAERDRSLPPARERDSSRSIGGGLPAGGPPSPPEVDGLTKSKPGCNL